MPDNMYVTIALTFTITQAVILWGVFNDFDLFIAVVISQLIAILTIYINEKLWRKMNETNK